MWYLAIDGDRVGDALERLILLDDLEGVRRFSSDVSSWITKLRVWLEERDCEIVFATGDGILAIAPADVELRQLPLQSEDITFSAGLSRSLPEALLALKTAKGLGRNRIVER